MLDYYQNAREEERRRKRLRFRRRALFFLFLVICVGTTLFLRSPFFRIEGVSISSGEYLEEKARMVIDNSLQNPSIFKKILFNEDNILLAYLQKNELSQELVKKIPSLASASVSVALLDRSLSVSIKEREKFGLWCHTGEDVQEPRSCLWFDSSGVAFAQGPSARGTLIRKVLDASHSIVAEGTRVLPQEYAGTLVRIFSFLEVSGLNIKTVVLDNPSLGEVYTVDPQFPSIYFSLRQDPSFALKAFEQLGDDIKDLEYIDLRVKNRVYYK